jgi:hypothetical protein
MKVVVVGGEREGKGDEEVDDGDGEDGEGSVDTVAESGAEGGAGSEVCIKRHSRLGSSARSRCMSITNFLMKEPIFTESSNALPSGIFTIRWRENLDSVLDSKWIMSLFVMVIP